MTNGLWHTEETEQVEKFINSFSRKKKPVYRNRQPSAPTDLSTPPEEHSTETVPRELPPLE
jgi:hypothetical protein